MIIATGATAMYLGLRIGRSLIREKAYRLAQLATVFSIVARKWLLVGGGNTAVEEALYLSNIADQVTIIHRRDKFRS